MSKTFKGYCTVQEKDFSVDLPLLSATTNEDSEEEHEYGTIHCEFIRRGGKCTAKPCSILKQNNIKR